MSTRPRSVHNEQSGHAQCTLDLEAEEEPGLFGGDRQLQRILKQTSRACVNQSQAGVIVDSRRGLAPFGLLPRIHPPLINTHLNLHNRTTIHRHRKLPPSHTLHNLQPHLHS